VLLYGRKVVSRNAAATDNGYADLSAVNLFEYFAAISPMNIQLRAIYLERLQRRSSLQYAWKNGRRKVHLLPP